MDADITLAYASNATGGCEARVAACNASINATASNSTEVSNSTNVCLGACEREVFNPLCDKFVGGRGTGSLLVKNVGSNNLTFAVDYAHDTYADLLSC